MQDPYRRFSVKDRLSSFRFAFQGLFRFARAEHNVWIHLGATVLVIAAGCWKSISRYEWIAILFAIGLVWITEALNTCIEKAMDMISPAKDERVRFIKDLSAGAVLIAAIIAAAVGCIVFIPKFFGQG